MIKRTKRWNRLQLEFEFGNEFEFVFVFCNDIEFVFCVEFVFGGECVFDGTVVNVGIVNLVGSNWTIIYVAIICVVHNKWESNKVGL